MHKFIRRGSYANVTATLALVLALGGTSYAAAQITGADIQNGSIKTADIANNAIKSTKVKNGSLKAVDFAAGQLPANVGLAALSSATITNATAFALVPGLSVAVTVPPGGGRILATFSAESACYGSSSYCNVRILVDGTEMDPVVGTDFAFDSTDNNTETSGSWESHSTQRYSANLAPGSHTVTVQAAVTGATTSFRLDDGVLSALVTQAG
ncbi:MAG: hypothetical protein JWO11_3012 [Nocardioides sp.]|nr:hypothetical protein [Nocardioides sp.]